jgi:hypothetical protein
MGSKRYEGTEDPKGNKSLTLCDYMSCPNERQVDRIHMLNRSQKSIQRRNSSPNLEHAVATHASISLPPPFDFDAHTKKQKIQSG